MSLFTQVMTNGKPVDEYRASLPDGKVISLFREKGLWQACLLGDGADITPLIKEGIYDLARAKVECLRVCLQHYYQVILQIDDLKRQKLPHL